jgi:DNA-3-methyladenine glycosylase
MAGRRLPRAWYRGEAVETAPQLLNKLLVVVDDRGVRRTGRIVEVEAYAGATDPASHAFRGPTRRNRVMFGPPGHLYVYFTYGMHWCANVVCGPTGRAQAVLLRALAPVSGIAAMRAGRGVAVPERDLCRGPARLTQAMGMTGADDGADLCRRGRIAVVDDGVAPPEAPASGPRVGISVAGEVPWRFWVPGDRHVSPFRGGGRGPRRDATPLSSAG